jgi:hypothetical protein
MQAFLRTFQLSTVPVQALPQHNRLRRGRWDAVHAERDTIAEGTRLAAMVNDRARCVPPAGRLRLRPKAEDESRRIAET